MAASSLALHRQQESMTSAATMLPAVAVVSNRMAPPVHEEISMLPAAIGEAQAAPALPLHPKSGSTIRLKDHSGAIIGQMAKIPLENEQITEIKAINDIDNDAGRELLSIISKY